MSPIFLLQSSCTQGVVLLYAVDCVMFPAPITRASDVLQEPLWYDWFCCFFARGTHLMGIGHHLHAEPLRHARYRIPSIFGTITWKESGHIELDGIAGVSIYPRLWKSRFGFSQLFGTRLGRALPPSIFCM